MKKLVKCDLGIRVAEKDARYIDSLLKQGMKYVKKGYTPDTNEFIDGEKADISLITTETPDKDGDVVISKGLNLEVYQKNPIVCYNHDYDILPVGRCSWMKKITGGVRAKTVYSEATELSKSIWKLTKEDILKGKSIGFLPVKLRSPKPEEKNFKDCCVIEESILLEYSVCSIPVNNQTFVEAVSKGRIDKKTCELLGLPFNNKEDYSDILELFDFYAKRLTHDAIIKIAKESLKA